MSTSESRTDFGTSGFDPSRALQSFVRENLFLSGYRLSESEVPSVPALESRRMPAKGLTSDTILPKLFCGLRRGSFFKRSIPSERLCK